MQEELKCGCGRELTDRDDHTYNGRCEVCYSEGMEPLVEWVPDAVVHEVALT